MSDPTSIVKQLLAAHRGLEHLCVEKRGKVITLVTPIGDERHAHARFTHVGGPDWGLSLPLHTGSWERTPFVGPIAELVLMLISDFGFHLADPRFDATASAFS